MIKDSLSTYDPNQRHWIKMKKDYLGMADTADLIVLGANYGTGRMGGLMSVYIMGVWDPDTDQFKTVCRVRLENSEKIQVGNGHDDKKIKELQTELKMVKISQDYSLVPDWLIIDKTFTPDFVVADPKEYVTLLRILTSSLVRKSGRFLEQNLHTLQNTLQILFQFDFLESQRLETIKIGKLQLIYMNFKIL